MENYNKETTCGELIVKINKEDNKYKINLLMKKFGDCSAYKFI
ncbi:MAG: hypothetical protein PVJ67_05935 [Candidatus Pacearchaeota archaeon]|jgi:hypothetical protein